MERSLGMIGWTETATLIGAQMIGGTLGTVLANLMFDIPAVSLST